MAFMSLEVLDLVAVVLDGLTEPPRPSNVIVRVHFAVKVTEPDPVNLKMVPAGYGELTVAPAAFLAEEM